MKNPNFDTNVNVNSQPILELNGVNGQLELFEDRIIIKRKGALSKLTQGFFKGDKTVYLNQMSGIQVKLGSLFINGYIQIILLGSQESKRGILDATKDENTVVFNQKDNELVSNIRKKIEELLGAYRQPSVIHNQLSGADEIKKYKQLLDEGIITQEEFNKKKRDILNI